MFCQKCDSALEVPIGYTLDFHAQTGGHCALSVSELLSCVGDGTVFLCGDAAISCEHPYVEDVIITFIF